MRPRVRSKRDFPVAAVPRGSRPTRSTRRIPGSRECVIQRPTLDLLDTVVDIGNCSGAAVDKFAAFGLTAQPARKVCAPLIGECHASFECRLHDGRWTGVVSRRARFRADRL